ncbi:hypothetical protein DMN91_005051 [Ooceraea biroi]|uniref:Transmembrane protein 18 n=1 Tax=Ooceraea biroi TaxID=2015173 RepID=A0A3L8DRF0_OOCBI|nr:transmembrane protein 18 isoform X1 [Ooceraea biroi]RLU22773.1 hypothetical protein DMN91_005051 [Ooceraea biroi]
MQQHIRFRQNKSSLFAVLLTLVDLVIARAMRNRIQLECKQKKISIDDFCRVFIAVPAAGNEKIDWRDPWLAVLLTFHIAITMTALMTRNHANFQIILFLVLLLLVYFSESINEVAATNWRVFSRQQYFDSKGLFISIVFSVPILINCMIMVASWLYQSSQLMTSLKRAQLRQQAKNRQLDGETNNSKMAVRQKND